MVTNAGTQFFKTNMGTIAAGIGGLAIGGAVGYAAARKSSKKRRSKSRKVSYSRTRKRKGARYTPYTARKRKDTSHKRIRYTKNGQPYVIMASGKARFIKKTGARRSHKQAGGRY
jgi:hypothetical protein